MLETDRLPPPWDDLKRAHPRLGPPQVTFAPGAHGLPPDADAWRTTFLAHADKVLAGEPLQRSVAEPGWQPDPALPVLSGWKPDPAKVAKELVRRMQYLCAAWQLTQDPKYVAGARLELLTFSCFEDWHPEVFLATARVAYGIAIGYDLLHDHLDAADRAQIGQALLKNAIEPALDAFAQHPKPFWTDQPHNWTLVCNSGLMVAAMAAAELDPAATRRLFDLCHDGLRKGLRGYAPDGAWFEGPGYWSLGTEYFIFLLDALRFALKGKMRELDKVDGFAATALFRRHAGGPTGLQYNYADSEIDQSLSWQMGWLSQHFDKPVPPGVPDMDADAPEPLDLMWSALPPYPPDQHPPTSAHFRSCEVVTMRGAWTDPDTTYLAIKGGRNLGHSHEHFDLGSFVLDAVGQRWAVDLGPDDYGIRDYFEPETRSRLYRTSTIGHNTLVVDGHCQQPRTKAGVTSFVQADDAVTAVIDLADAYPMLAGARRGCALIGGRHALLVDEIGPGGPGTVVAWQMHTPAQPAASGADATLTLGGQRLFLRILEPAGAQFAIADAVGTYEPPLNSPGETPNTGIKKLVIELSPSAPLRLAVLLSPDPLDPAVVPPRLHGALAAWA